jgi:integrase
MSRKRTEVEPAPKSKRRGRVYQRAGTWWADFSHKGTRHRRPLENVTSERKAWDAMEALRADVRQGRRLEAESARWSHLAQRLLDHHEAKGTRPRTLARCKQLLAHLGEYFGSSPVGEVAESVNGYVALRRRKKAAAATIRMELAVLKQAFRLSGLPLDVPTIEVRNVRSGFLEADDVERVAANLPPALRPPVWFAFFTGWRKSEVLGLEWRNVNLAAGTVRLDPGTTKSGAGRLFPIGGHPSLAGLLREQRDYTAMVEREQHRVVAAVFHREGAPIEDMDDAWRTACKAAGKPGALFHDLRRSFALQMRRLGLSETDIMELAGWRTPSMFRRYCVADESGLAERLRRAVSGTTSAQGQNPGAAAASE